MSAWIRDLGFALRLVRRTPLVSAAVVLTFALGIGANVAIFSVAWPALGAPLAFPAEERLAFILLSIERNGGARPNQISPGDYFDLLESRSFDSLAGFNMFVSQRNYAPPSGDPTQIRIATVTEDFFKVLAVPPIAGRPLTPADFTPEARPLVLNEAYWRDHFNADPGVIGSTLSIDGAPWTVVGVMPKATTVGTVDADAWSTQPIDRATARQMRSYFLAMIGRLKPGVSIDAANAELAALMRVVAERYPVSNKVPSTGAPFLARAESFRERLTGPVRPTFLLLLGGAGLVLIVAGINICGLQIARHLARRQELSVRRALGAARSALVRQLTIECLVLAVAGGLAGLVVASLTLGALARYAPSVSWYEVSPRLTTPVVLFTIGLTFAAGLVMGLVPAIMASATRKVTLEASRGGTAVRRTTRLRTTIIGAQVATTMVLLIAATLTAMSLGRVLRVNPGFEIDRGLIADVRMTNGDQSDGIRFFDELVARAGALPGVERACAINNIPLDNAGGGMTFVAEGKTDADMEGALPMGVSDGCFETLRIPVVRGRGFQRVESDSVAIVNESMAKALWPDGADPVGKRVHLGLVSGPLFTVVGVVKDIRASALESGFVRQVWMSASRGWPMPQRLMLRTTVPPDTLARPLRNLLREMRPDLALANVRTMQDIVGQATASRRFVLSLLGGFAAIALALCAIGIYGLLAYQVGQRTREIGIRLALGAKRAHITRTILAPVLAGVAGGLAIGWIGARLLARLIATQLYQMSATDSRVYLGVTGFVLAVALASCWAPMRRAARVDPVIALRSE
jgi:predicted permease